jgi:hypothetical protein
LGREVELDAAVIEADDAGGEACGSFDVVGGDDCRST